MAPKESELALSVMSAVPEAELTLPIAVRKTATLHCLTAMVTELPEKNTFIDYPPSPMARPLTPTASAPGFLQHFRNRISQSGQAPIPHFSAKIADWDEDTLQVVAAEMPSRIEDDKVSFSASLAPHKKPGGQKSISGLQCVSEDFLEKNTFIDYPPSPMAHPPTPTASAPAFLERFKNNEMLQSGPYTAPYLASHEQQDQQVAQQFSTASQFTACDHIFPPDANSCCNGGSPPPVESCTGILDCGSSTDCASDLPEAEDLAEEVPELPSVGSVGHIDGSCRPCAWNWKPHGCRSGENCLYCHLCPDGIHQTVKKAKLAILRQGKLSEQQPSVECGIGLPSSRPPRLEQVAYIECDPASSSSVSAGSDEMVKNAVHVAQNGAEVEAATGPVKVSVKNTFIQFDVPSMLQNSSEPPLRSAPGDFFQRFFQTKTLEESVQVLPPIATHAEEINRLIPTHAMYSSVVDTERTFNGVQAHDLGKCTPCAYFWYKKDGCRKGDDCQFCHLCQKGEIKRRKKDRIQQLKASGAYMPGHGKMRRAMLQEAQFGHVECVWI